MAMLQKHAEEPNKNEQKNIKKVKIIYIYIKNIFLSLDELKIRNAPGVIIFCSFSWKAGISVPPSCSEITIYKQA